MLKRFLILACSLALFITAFFIHQAWVDAKIEGRFRDERAKFNVDGQELVTTTPPVAEPLTPTPPPLPVVSTGNLEGSVPTVTPAPAPGSPADVPLDTNTLIGPVPPPPAGTPTDIKTPAVPAAPATNASPDSTMLYPLARRLPLLMLGSYGQPRVQTTDAVPAVPAAPAPEASPASAPATNSPTAPPAPAIMPEPKFAAPSHMPASVIVLGYHQFTPPGIRAGGKMIYTMPQDVFETEMKYLADNHYNVVPLSDVVAFAKKEKTLPPNTVAITIDDGYKSPLAFAAPVLKKYNFPWTFFVYPAFIGNHPNSSYYRGAASWPELVELQKEGVDIECHSMTHPQLTHHGSKTPEQYDAWLTNEVVNSKAILEQKLGKTIKYFAYPYGEYNKQVEARTISAGYDAIFTVANNPIHPGTNVYAMGRYIITAPVEKAFVSYLHEGALGLANIMPAPGATVNDPRPVISAALGYDGNINPKSIVAEVSNMGEVRYDFDPKSLMLRLYLPRDLIDPAVKVNIYAKDADTGKTMVASWRFNYQPTASGVHAPIGAEPAGTKSAAPEPAVHLGVPTGVTNVPATETAPSAASKATPAPGTTIESNAVPAVPATGTNSAP